MGEGLHYPRMISELTEQDSFEIRLKGWHTLQVELEDGSQYSLNFFDPVRLEQEFVEEVALGRPCFTEPGLVIVPEVTVEAMRKSVQFLYELGYFTNLWGQE